MVKHEYAIPLQRQSVLVRGDPTKSVVFVQDEQTQMVAPEWGDIAVLDLGYPANEN